MTGQVRRYPAPRPPPGEQGPPPAPDVASRAKAVQQHQKRLPAAALVNPQTSLHGRSLPPRPRAGAIYAGHLGVEIACLPGPQRWVRTISGPGKLRHETASAGLM